MRGEGAPPVQEAVVPLSLDQERPEIAPLAVAVRGGPLGVAEERPEVVLADRPGALVPRVEREEAELLRGGGPVGSLRPRQDRVVPAERPQEEGVAGRPRPMGGAEDRPDPEPARVAAREADEGPRDIRDARVPPVGLDVEGEGGPGEP